MGAMLWMAVLAAVPPAGGMESGDVGGGGSAGAPPPAAFLFDIPAELRTGAMIVLAAAIAIYLFINLRNER